MIQLLVSVNFGANVLYSATVSYTVNNASLLFLREEAFSQLISEFKFKPELILIYTSRKKIYFMITRSSVEIKHELANLTQKQLLDLCTRLIRFKKENKELLSYILFYAHNEAAFIESAKQEIDEAFDGLNASNWYFIKKGLRKILRTITKYNRFSGSKEAEVEMLMHFVSKMKDFNFTEKKYKGASVIYDAQIIKLTRLIDDVHEDLQFDYRKQLDNLNILPEPQGKIVSIFKKISRF